MLKKVYIEITNCCNLHCDFCIQNKREQKFMTVDEFKIVLEKLKGHTKYLYFHILGEPLMHPNFDTLVALAKESGFFVNITTNGYLLPKIKGMSNIRQLNISLHSYHSKYGISVEDYMASIFDVVETLPDTYISYRLWAHNPVNAKMLELLNEKYHTSFRESDLKGNQTIKENVFLSSFHEFIWPDLHNTYYDQKGTCYALLDHIGILVDGTIVPCCLDTKGDIALGNIFKDSLDTVLHSRRVTQMKDGFKQHEKCEELCRHCSFLDT